MVALQPCKGMIEIPPIHGDIRNGLLLGVPHHPHVDNLGTGSGSIMSRPDMKKKNLLGIHSGA